jgi:hypothetical protein
MDGHAPEAGPENPEMVDPAKVYPDPQGADRWVVEAARAGAVDRRVFDGPNAEAAALEFAHRNYGGARFFTR